MTDLSFYVPHISRESLDAEATAFLEAYCPEAIKAPIRMTCSCISYTCFESRTSPICRCKKEKMQNDVKVWF